MKTRNGFVSNSSSASFIVRKDLITIEQENKIINYMEEAKKENWRDLYSDWTIVDNEWYIFSSTIIDNFGMDDWFRKIKLNEKAYCIEKYCSDILKQYEKFSDDKEEIERILRICGEVEYHSEIVTNNEGIEDIKREICLKCNKGMFCRIFGYRGCLIDNRFSIKLSKECPYYLEHVIK